MKKLSTASVVPAPRSNLAPRSPRPPGGALVGCGLMVLACVLITGCATFGRSESRRASSVVDFLYPKDNPPPIHDGVPVLNLPLRVGVAWVPETTGQRPYAAVGAVSETQKSRLIEALVPHFSTNAFIGSV